METKMEFIQKALNEHRVLRIDYLPVDCRKSQVRDVEVYVYDHTYLEGYCRLRQFNRVFRIDQIQKIELLNERFQPDPWWIECFKRYGHIRQPRQRLEVVKPLVVEAPQGGFPPVPGLDQGESRPPVPSKSGGLLRRLLRFLTWGIAG